MGTPRNGDHDELVDGQGRQGLEVIQVTLGLNVQHTELVVGPGDESAPVGVDKRGDDPSRVARLVDGLEGEGSVEWGPRWVQAADGEGEHEQRSPLVVFGVGEVHDRQGVGARGGHPHCVVPCAFPGTQRTDEVGVDGASRLGFVGWCIHAEGPPPLLDCAKIAQQTLFPSR